MDMEQNKNSSSEPKGYIAKTAWEVFYDFLTEIFAILIPGAFFTSFFVFAALICVGFMNSIDSGISAASGSVKSVIGLLVAAITYCFGFFFHRREIKIVDQKSARHIYTKRDHDSGHSFAFANALSESYVRRIAFILQYHLYLYEWDVRKPHKIRGSVECTEGAGSTGGIQNQGERLVDRLNGVICKELQKTIELAEALTVEDEQIRTLANRFTNPKEGDIFQMGLVDIVRRKILAEKSEVRKIDRSCSREYKSFLAWLNAERHGTLKDRLEVKVWREMADFFSKQTQEEEKKIPGAAERTERRETGFYQDLRKAVDGLCSRELVNDRFPEIPERNKKMKEFLELTRKIQIPIIKKEDGEAQREKGQDGEKTPGENEQLEHALRRIRDLVDDDLNSPVEWPYTRMYQYCFDRGLDFADLVEWGDGAAAEDDYVYVIDTLGLTTDASISDEYRRSKIRVNTDKVEIGLEEPAIGRVLEKNEAHIRFNNSMWYAAKLLQLSLIVIGGFCIAFSLAAYIVQALGFLPQGIGFLPQTVEFLTQNSRLWGYLIVLCLLYLGACVYSLFTVREIMHYQRVREVTMYLEAKHLIAKRQK